MERQFIVTAQLADDADPERTRQAIADAIAYEGSTTDFGGLASTATHGQADELPEGALRVELVDLVPDEGVVVTRPELDRALRDAILGGVGILVNMDGTIVAGRPPLHAVRKLWPDITASLRETGHAWLQRTDDPASVVLIPTGTIRVELDPLPESVPEALRSAPAHVPTPTESYLERQSAAVRTITGRLDLADTRPDGGSTFPPGLRSIVELDPTGTKLIGDAAARMEALAQSFTLHTERELNARERQHLAVGGKIVLDFYSAESELTPDAPVTELADGRRVHVRCVPSGMDSAASRPEIPQMGVRCPDKGKCHHDCSESCYRVRTCEPLSGVFPGDEWPVEITARWG